MMKNHGEIRKKRYGRRGSDHREKPAFMSPAYIDDDLVRLVRSHIIKELFSQTDSVAAYTAGRMHAYLGTRENVPDSFWEQSLESVLKRSTSGLSRLMGDAVSDAFDVILESSIRQILRPEQYEGCGRQIRGRMGKIFDSMKLTVRGMIIDSCGSMSLREFRDGSAASFGDSAEKERTDDYYCEIKLKSSEKKALKKWYADLAEKRKDYEKSRLREKLEKKERMERELAQQAKVLTAIPERYRDLYPRARAMNRRFILHSGPTNSGKTFDAMNRLKTASSGVYLGPLRLLAYEQFEYLNARGIPCSLVTGEEQEIVEGATITASTVEMADLHSYYEAAVIDEAQLITDSQRGGAWTNAILGLCAEEIHVCCSPDAEELLLSIIRECEDEVAVVHHDRMVPLIEDTSHFTFPDGVSEGDALIVFSRRSVHAVAATVRDRGFQCSIVYGALPYDVRHEQARLFAAGYHQVIVATDAIGLGMNLPIKRVVFLETEKFDGYEIRDLRITEIKQIAGRAGRYGIYNTGYYTALADKNSIARAVGSEYPSIGTPVIDFPESLLSVDLSLKETILRWRQAGVHTGWSRGDTDRMLDLLSYIPGDDKRLQYDLITMAFDEEDQILMGLWKQMARAEAAAARFDVQKALPGIGAGGYDAGSLDKLERKFRICDLLYSYLRKFNPDTLLMNEVSAVKSRITHEIIRILEKQRFQGRRCRLCGRKLPWNYEYSICEICYERSI